MILSSFINPYSLFKTCAFRIDPEKAHHLSIGVAKRFPELGKILVRPFDSEKYRVKTNYLDVPFPIGLAAGLDKNAECIDFFSNLQFGFIEVGTVTPRPQAGNDRPRLFRLIEEDSLRNRMGFNNQGMERVFENLKRAKSKSVVGVNLGKNKTTEEKLAVKDYVELFHYFKNVAQYLVINISSPNTVGLRDLQNESFLKELMTEIGSCGGPPLFLKIAPDLSNEDISNIVNLAMNLGFQGLIATNTCLRPDIGEGGISGRLLTKRAAEVRKICLQITKENKNFDFIGVGGISGFDDVWQFWKAGGKIAQVYSAFIYQGPNVILDIKSGIDKKLIQHELGSFSELIENIEHL